MVEFLVHRRARGRLDDSTHRTITHPPVLHDPLDFAPDSKKPALSSPVSPSGLRVPRALVTRIGHIAAQIPVAPRHRSSLAYRWYAALRSLPRHSGLHAAMYPIRMTNALSQ